MPYKSAERFEEWKEENGERRKGYYLVYNHTPEGKKRDLKFKWKRRGLIHDDFETLYTSYVNATNCDLCDVVFEGKGKNMKCMDHDHTTGKFRNFLCKSCNVKRR